MAQPPALAQMWAFFAVVPDPRRQHPTTLHALETILTSTILATMCGAQNWGEIAPWGQAKAAWLAEFLDLAHGLPSHDTFGRVFAVLDPASLPQAFVAWMQALAELRQGLVALEGKTIRRSLDSAEGTGPMHVVKAWASAHAVGLAQCKVDTKINESTALPELRRVFGSPLHAWGQYWKKPSNYLSWTKRSPSKSRTTRSDSPCVRMAKPCSVVALCRRSALPPRSLSQSISQSLSRTNAEILPTKTPGRSSNSQRVSSPRTLFGTFQVA